MIDTNSDFQIRVMLVGDINAADELRSSAGWNQTQSDWERLLNYEPSGCFVACCNGAVVGTVTTTSYENRLGWIGMMLVDQAYRRKGIATALMIAATNYLNSRGVACIKLDATPDGEFVYRQLGFQSEWPFNRWTRQGDGGNVAIVPDGNAPESWISDLDAFGVDRSKWLESVARHSTVIVGENAFGMMRNGTNASYLGPVIAAAPESAEAIVRELLSKTSGKVIWDMPGPNVTGVELCRKLGFEPVRDLLRMWTGSELLRPNSSRQFGLCDPGTG